jgi:hypothetical protein
VAEGDKDGAYRAAGQVIAALAEGLAIESVSASGIVLTSGDGPPRQPNRHEVLAEIAIGLTGIAALDRYWFGAPPPNEPDQSNATVWQSFDAWQLADFKEVHKLIALIDADGAQDVLYQAWQQASSLIEIPAVWDAIEFFAALLEGFPLDAAEIDDLCPEVFAGLEGFDPTSQPISPARSLS